MRATAKFTLYSVPPLLVIPLLLALILNGQFRGRTVFRAIYFAPYVLGVAVIGVLWQFVLDANIGLLNSMLGRLGIDANIAWTTATPWVWVSLVGVTVWWTLGFNAVIYLAGLQEIPREQYEAAAVDHPDGAGVGEHVRSVTAHHAGRARQRNAHRDHVYRRGRTGQLPHGQRHSDELRPDRVPGPDQHRHLCFLPTLGGLAMSSQDKGH
jgi:hypothetical protein